MSALSIIEAAAAEGLIVDLSQNGLLKIRGEQKVVSRWQPLLKQHKAEIINLLNREPGGAVQATRPLPPWCRTGCPGLEAIPLPNEGEVVGCVHPVTGAWRRLDWMKQCAALEKTTPPVLPSWCNENRCAHFHRLVVTEIGTSLWCCWEKDETHWRRERIDTMSGCPMQEAD